MKELIPFIVAFAVIYLVSIGLVLLYVHKKMPSVPSVPSLTNKNELPDIVLEHNEYLLVYTDGPAMGSFDAAERIGAFFQNSNKKSRVAIIDMHIKFQKLRIVDKKEPARVGHTDVINGDTVKVKPEDFMKNTVKTTSGKVEV